MNLPPAEPTSTPERSPAKRPTSAHRGLNPMKKKSRKSSVDIGVGNLTSADAIEYPIPSAGIQSAGIDSLVSSSNGDLVDALEMASMNESPEMLQHELIATRMRAFQARAREVELLHRLQAAQARTSSRHQNQHPLPDRLDGASLLFGNNVRLAGSGMGFSQGGTLQNFFLYGRNLPLTSSREQSIGYASLSSPPAASQSNSISLSLLPSEPTGQGSLPTRLDSQLVNSPPSSSLSLAKGETIAYGQNQFTTLPGFQRANSIPSPLFPILQGESMGPSSSQNLAVTASVESENLRSMASSHQLHSFPSPSLTALQVATLQAAKERQLAAQERDLLLMRLQSLHSQSNSSTVPSPSSSLFGVDRRLRDSGPSALENLVLTREQQQQQLFLQNQQQQELQQLTLQQFHHRQQQQHHQKQKQRLPLHGSESSTTYVSLTNNESGDTASDDASSSLMIPHRHPRLKLPPELNRTTLLNNGSSTLLQPSSTEEGKTDSDVREGFVERAGILDVICGRGGRSNHHEGNKRYRSVVSEMKDAYKNSAGRKNKTHLSRLIVEHVIAYGGKFLREDEETGHYYVLTKSEARIKTSQALREVKDLKWTG